MSTLPVVQQQHDVRAALHRLRREGHALDPDDATHVAAYMAIRSGLARVGLARVTGQKVLQYIATKDRVSGLARVGLGVPKENFPSGLPDDLKEFVRDVDVGGELDMSSFYLLDESAPLQRLGQNVLSLKFLQSVQTQNSGRPQAVLALDAPPNAEPAATDAATAGHHRPPPPQPSPSTRAAFANEMWTRDHRWPPPPLRAATGAEEQLEGYDSSRSQANGADVSGSLVMEPAPRDQDPWLALLLEDWFSPQQGLASASTQGSGLGLPTIREHPKASLSGGKAAPPVPPAPTPKRRKAPSPRLIRQLVDSGADGSESEADDSAVDASLTELVERFRLTLAGQSLPISRLHERSKC